MLCFWSWWQSFLCVEVWRPTLSSSLCLKKHTIIITDVRSAISYDRNSILITVRESLITHWPVDNNLCSITLFLTEGYYSENLKQVNVRPHYGPQCCTTSRHRSTRPTSLDSFCIVAILPWWQLSPKIFRKSTSYKAWLITRFGYA